MVVLQGDEVVNRNDGSFGLWNQNSEQTSKQKWQEENVVLAFERSK